ncbi:glycosyltransferase [Dyadobacter sp. 3J3]|uniref:glycosyltransferase n=1 Tax=Dyadobacter sp. 3J3 TaxID=2606600 RepID=UPI00135B1328|nr:glycosyltransferase [Dyadobacter sp. 3J3]
MSETINNGYFALKKLFYFLVSIRNFLFSNKLEKNQIKNIPIIINNRNRLTFLKSLIDFLETGDYRNIIIIDNNSSYEPLLSFYASCPYRIIRLDKNMGYNALEKIDLYNEVKSNYYVYTDSDVVPDANCPTDFLDYFYKLLRQYPLVQKVGFSLRIDNLPDHYKDKDKVIRWESQFYLKEIKTNLYSASIDTTFALHRPFSYISKRGIFSMIRTGAPYTAWHMPWYNDSDNFSSEEEYYINSVEIGTHWSKGLNIEGHTLLQKMLSKFKSTRGL